MPVLERKPIGSRWGKGKEESGTRLLLDYCERLMSRSDKGSVKVWQHKGCARRVSLVTKLPRRARELAQEAEVEYSVLL
jgi:hypothetical protein